MEPDCQTNCFEITDLIRLVKEKQGSDIILSVGVSPHAKIRGELHPLGDTEIRAEQMEPIISSLLSSSALSKFRTCRTLDQCICFGEHGMVRFNFYYQQGHPALVGRLIETSPPAVDSLGLPFASQSLLNKRSGLILVTGPAGSGKSTTLASFIDFFNRTKRYHIVSIEDPIEYRHKHNQSVIEQVEIGSDAHTFEEALKACLRQSPDVIVIGEVRDKPSMEIALTLAETGHLVMATVHARDASQAISRIVDVFPADQQNQISCLLSQVLCGVISQQLIPDTENTQMILAAELLLTCPAVQNLIRDRKIDQLYSVMQSSGIEGMVTMNDSLDQLVRRDIIGMDDALTRTSRPSELVRLVNRKPQKR